MFGTLIKRYIYIGISLNILSFPLNFQMSGLGQSPMALLSHDSNTGGGSNHSSAGTGVEPSPEKPVTTPRTPTERKRKRKTNASGPSLQGEYLAFYSASLGAIHLTHGIWQIQLWCQLSYGWNFSISGLKMMMKSGLGKIFLKFLHALTM